MSDRSEFTVLKPGMVVNGFRIERELGRGAMAIVYLTRQLDLDRPVALKVMSSAFASNKDYVRRFFNEVRTAAALSHPNIIQAYDAGVAFNSTYYFAMEYVEGESMLHKIEKDGPIPIEEALEYAREIASALDYGWQKKRFRHGDIKPENFMVQSNGHVKLADFGLAMVKGHEYQGNEVMLTPHYAAPELIRGQRSADNCLADIYAFGASLYHVLSGTTPFPGNDAREVMRCHLTEKLEPLHRRCPGIPKYLSDFVGEMMVKNPADRIQDWKMVLNGIEAVLERYSSDRGHRGVSRELNLSPAEVAENLSLHRQRLIQAQLYRKFHRRRSLLGRTWLPLLTSAVVLLVLGLFFWLRQPGSGEEDTPLSGISGEAALPVPDEVAKPAAVPESPHAQAAAEKPSGAAVEAGKKQLASAAGGEGGDDATRDRQVQDSRPLEVAVRPGMKPPEKMVFSQSGKEPLPGKLEKELPPVKISPADRIVLPDYSIPLPADQEMLDALYLTELQILLRSLDYSFGEMRDVEKLQRESLSWRKNHPDARGITAAIGAYLVDQMAPMLESYPAFLIQMEPVLGKVRIHTRSQRSLWYRIISIQLDGIILEQNFPKGKIRLPLKSWSELRKDGLLKKLLILAYRKDQYPLRGLRLFHYLLLEGDFAECRILLKDSPEDYQPVLTALLQLCAVNSRERRSLALFQEILQAGKQGARASLGQLLTEFQYHSSQVAKRNHRLCGYLIDKCRDSITGAAGARLITQAMQCGAGNPGRALEFLLRAEGIYPGDYPEARMIGEVYSQILKVQKNSRLPGDFNACCPFRDYGKGAGVFTRWQMLQNLSGGVTAADSFHSLFVHAEAGLKRREFLQASCPENLSRGMHLSRLFARALIGIVRFSEEDAEPFKEVFLKTPEKSVRYGYMLMEYLLLTHRNSLYTADYNLNLYDFLKLIDPLKDISPHHLRFWKLSLAVKLECQQRQEVLNDLNEFFRKFEAAQGRIPEKNLEVLKEMRVFDYVIRRNDEDAGSLLRLLLERHPEAAAEDLRLFMGCCGKAFMDGRADQLFWDWYSRNAGISDLLGGNVLYDFILRRIGYSLARGDAAGAVALTGQALSKAPAAHLWLYFARMHFLRGGLLALGGRSGGLADTAALLAGSAWASEAEKKMIRENDSLEIEFASVGFGNYLCFWEDWLKNCQALGEHRDVGTDFTTGKDTMKAEAVLMDGLGRFYKIRKTSGKVVWSKEY